MPIPIKDFVSVEQVTGSDKYCVSLWSPDGKCRTLYKGTCDECNDIASMIGATIVQWTEREKKTSPSARVAKASDESGVPSFTGEELHRMVRLAGFRLMSQIDDRRRELAELRSGAAPRYRFASLPMHVEPRHPRERIPEVERKIESDEALLGKINTTLARHDIDVVIPAIVESVKEGPLL